MRRVRWDLTLVSTGAVLIVGATLLRPSAGLDKAAGIVGFLLVLAGAWFALKGLGPGGPGGGSGGSWGGGPSGGEGGGHHHGGGSWGGGHGGGGHGGGHG